MTINGFDGSYDFLDLRLPGAMAGWSWTSLAVGTHWEVMGTSVAGGDALFIINGTNLGNPGAILV